MDTSNDSLAEEIRMMEREGYRAPRWQRGLSWLRELQQLRAAKAADRERVEDVVKHVVSERLRGSDQFSAEGIAAFAEHVASRVADALAVSGRVGLSEGDCEALQRTRAHLANQIDKWRGWPRESLVRRELEALDRLLSTRPIPPLVRELVQREFERVPAGAQHDWERQRLAECLEVLK